MLTTQSWDKWLNGHPARAVYNANPDKVMSLCNGQTDSVLQFKRLVENKNLVLLSWASLGGKCQATFYHSIVGIPMMAVNVHYVDLSNIKFGTGVEIVSCEVCTVSHQSHESGEP